VRNFFHTCRDQFKLDDALREYEQSCSETVQELFRSLPAGTQLLVIVSYLFILTKFCFMPINGADVNIFNNCRPELKFLILT
jgi:hypothetical protein